MRPCWAYPVADLSLRVQLFSLMQLDQFLMDQLVHFDSDALLDVAVTADEAEHGKGRMRDFWVLGLTAGWPEDAFFPWVSVK